MIYINLTHKGAANEVIQFAALPQIGSEILHPKHGGIRVKDVIFDIHDKTGEVSITLLTVPQEEYENAQKK